MNKGDLVIRWAAAVAVMIVTGIAAVISYQHAHELVLHHGEKGYTAAALPITVDGLIGTCSLVLLDCARRNRKAPWHAWVLLGAGVVATVGANIAHGLAHGWVGAVVAGWPALVAVGSFELLIRLVRDGRNTSSKLDEGREPVLAEVAQPSPKLEEGSPPALDVPAVPAAEVERVPDEVPVLVPDPHQVHAAAVFAEDLGKGEIPSIRAIKSTLKIGQPKAREVRDYLTVLASQ